MAQSPPPSKEVDEWLKVFPERAQTQKTSPWKPAVEERNSTGSTDTSMGLDKTLVSPDHTQKLNQQLHVLVETPLLRTFAANQIQHTKCIAPQGEIFSIGMRGMVSH